MKKTLFTLCALGLSLSTYAQSLLGDWNGTIKLGPNSLPLVFHISSTNGQAQCLMDSPDQGAKGIPTTVDFLAKDSIAIHITAIGAAYQGKLNAGIIKGRFSQNGMQFKLDLKPGDFVRERKQTPKPPFPYPTTEVEFVNPSDQAHLAGTLTYPITFAMNQQVPVVLMVTGSGQQNRDEEIMGHKPFAVIADFLAKMGIASLRYDDRGYGKSTGDFKNATSHTFMTDALAGINYLKKDKRFNKIGILGHSEGGLIAFMCAGEATNELDFIVSLAGTAVRGDEILIKQNELLLSAQKVTALYSDSYSKVLRKVLQHRINRKPVHDAKAIVEQYLTESKVELPENLVANLQQVLTIQNQWMDYMISYDPSAAISKITCPVMAINGEKDLQVDAEMNLGALKKTLKENESHLIKSYPSLNHLFQHCKTGFVNEYATSEETISPEVLEDIAQWILGLK